MPMASSKIIVIVVVCLNYRHSQICVTRQMLDDGLFVVPHCFIFLLGSGGISLSR